MAVGTGTIIAVVILCILIIVGTILAVYFTKVTCPDFGYECTPATSSPAPGSGKESILNTAKSLYPGPTDLKAGWNPAGIPVKSGTIAGSGAVTYTLSFYVKPGPAVANNGVWPNVFLRGNSSTNQTNRCPGIWFESGKLSLTLIHSGTTNKHDNGISSSALTAGEWSHITMVVNNNVMMVYVNGVLDKTYTATDPFVWGTSDNAWVSMGTSTDPTVTGDWAKPNDSLEVKDYYWWNRALTASEVGTLAGVSTYMPEQKVGTSGDVKEGYMRL